MDTKVVDRKVAEDAEITAINSVLGIFNSEQREAVAKSAGINRQTLVDLLPLTETEKEVVDNIADTLEMVVNARIDWGIERGEQADITFKLVAAALKLVSDGIKEQRRYLATVHGIEFIYDGPGDPDGGRVVAEKVTVEDGKVVASEPV